MREDRQRQQAERAFLDPDLDELRLYIVPPAGEPFRVADDYLTRNRRGARIAQLRPVTHTGGPFPLTTSLWVVLSDGREILCQTTRFFSRIRLAGSPALQRLSDTLQLLKLQAERRS